MTDIRVLMHDERDAARTEVERAVSLLDAWSTLIDLTNRVDADLGPAPTLEDVRRHLPDEPARARWTLAVRTLADHTADEHTPNQGDSDEQH